jgi:hypothetical protein
MKAVIISKYRSDSPTANSMELIERVFPLEVHGVLKIGIAVVEI